MTTRDLALLLSRPLAVTAVFGLIRNCLYTLASDYENFSVRTPTQFRLELGFTAAAYAVTLSIAYLLWFKPEVLIPVSHKVLETTEYELPDLRRGLVFCLGIFLIVSGIVWSIRRTAILLQFPSYPELTRNQWRQIWEAWLTPVAGLILMIMSSIHRRLWASWIPGTRAYNRRTEELSGDR